jgi:hypothetical protein
MTIKNNTQRVRNYNEKQPKAWQNKYVMRHVRRCYNSIFKGKGRRLTTALAIYQTLTELESNNEANAKPNGFPSSYDAIANNAGVSYSTARRYCNDFIKICVLRKENNTGYTNKWILLNYSPMNFVLVQSNEQGIADGYSNIKNEEFVQNTGQTAVQNNDQH